MSATRSPVRSPGTSRTRGVSGGTSTRATRWRRPRVSARRTSRPDRAWRTDPMTITDLDIAHRIGASGPALRAPAPRDAVRSRDRARMRAWFAVLGVGATAAWLGVVGVRALLGAGDL